MLLSIRDLGFRMQEEEEVLQLHLLFQWPIMEYQLLN